MAKVAIVMGSDSDMPIMKKAAEFLDQMGIDFEMTIISAHREPDIFFEWAKGAKDRGVKSDHCRCWKGSTSSRYVCSFIPNASYRYSDEDFRSRWC